MKTLIFITRPSQLARWQTGWVCQALQNAWPQLSCFERLVVTTGDRVLDKPLPEIGGKGLFTQELEAELLAGNAQAAVHSLKDLPVEIADELMIGAIPERGDARDVLVSAWGYTLETLPQGARVGTSSLRRSSQLLHLRPDLRIESLRGNVDTRLRKAREGQYDAILLAGAGVTRLGLEDEVTQWLSLEVMLPAPGQGALAVQCRAQDDSTRQLIEAIEDPGARQATQAERAFLQGIGGGCALPVAAYAQVEAGGITLTGLAASVDGKQLLRKSMSGGDPLALGAALAEQFLAAGAGEFLPG